MLLLPQQSLLPQQGGVPSASFELALAFALALDLSLSSCFMLCMLTFSLPLHADLTDEYVRGNGYGPGRVT